MQRRGFGMDDLDPYIIGVGVGYNALVVTLRDDAPYWVDDQIPTELDRSSALEGLPVLIDYSGPLQTLQGPRGPGGMFPSSGSRGLMGGQSIQCKEQGTIFSVLSGVSDPSKKYVATSSHVVQKGSCQCGGCRFIKDAMPCNQKVYLDCSIVGLITGPSSPNIIGMGGPPKGFKKPQVGMKIHQGGVRSGHVDSEITQINFTQKGNTYMQGTCPVTFLDMFVTSRCGTNGDSVSNDTRLYWKEDDKLMFGTMDDLFLSYTNSTNKNQFYILSGYRKPDAFHNKPLDRFSPNTIKIGFTNIRNVMFHGIKPVWRVELRNGKHIEVTEDHSLFGFDKMDASYDHFLTSQPFDGLKSITSIDNYNIHSNIELDDNICIFSGLWLADGSYMYCPKGTYHRGEKYEKRINGVSISTGNNSDVKSWLDQFAYKYSNFWNGEMSNVITHRVNGDSRLFSVILANDIKENFGLVDSYTKRVPKQIFTADNNSIASFLRGYFSGDGSVHPRSGHYVIDCSSVNRALIEDIQILLDRLGIKSNITTGYSRGLCWGKYQQRLQYKLKIEFGQDVNRFMNVVGFIQSKPFDVRTRFNGKKDRPISMRRIRKIEFIGDKPVYDISTASETFIANGILCHNSGSAQWDDERYLIGIVTFGSTEHGGAQDRNCRGYNPSAWRIPSLLGVTTQTGATATTIQQLAQNRRQQGSWVS
jgi:hypothetical protein